MSENTLPPEQELVITRTFAAPRSLVWKAFSEAEALGQWWGPKDFHIEVKKLEFRPGGIFLYSMDPGNGEKMWGRFIYREIVPEERIIFINSFSDENGGMTRAPFFEGHWPLEVLNNMTLEENGAETLLTLRGGPLNATPEELQAFIKNQASMHEGFEGSWKKLDTYLQFPHS